MDRRKFLLTTTSIISSIPFLINTTGCKTEESKISYSEDPRIEKLNIAIEHEFGAIVQYSNHGAIINNLKFKNIITQIIFQEVRHAIQIGEIIKLLGYYPTLSVWPPQTGKNFKEILEKDIEAEKNAIELYQEIIKLDLPKSAKKIIFKIIKTEETHLKIFKNFNISP